MIDRPQPEHISLDTFVANTAALYERMQNEGGSVLVEYGDMLFSVRPAHRRRPKRARRKPRHLTADDPFFSIIGIADSGGPGDVSTNIHKYIAEAIASYKGLSPTKTSDDATTQDVPDVLASQPSPSQESLERMPPKQ